MGSGRHADSGHTRQGQAISIDSQKISISDLPRDGKQLTLRFKSASGGLLSLMLRLYPTGAVIELATRFENLGQHDLLLDSHIDPLCFTLKNPPGNLTPYSSVQGQHGFQTAGSLSSPREFPDWTVLQNEVTGESALIGGEPGLGILGWKATARPSPAAIVVRAGTLLAERQHQAALLRSSSLLQVRRWKRPSLSSRLPREIQMMLEMRPFDI